MRLLTKSEVENISGGYNGNGPSSGMTDGGGVVSGSSGGSSFYLTLVCMKKSSPVFMFVTTFFCGLLTFAILSRIGVYFTFSILEIPLWLANWIAGVAMIVGLVRIVEIVYYVLLPKISGRLKN